MEEQKIRRLELKNVKAAQWVSLFRNLIQKGAIRKPLNSSTEIRITRLCTQRCRQCRVYERTTDPPTMSWPRFQVIAQKLRAYGAYIGFISGGEPTLAPHLDKILVEAKKTFAISTTLVTGLINKTETIRKIGKIALENDINIQTSLDGLGKVGDDLRGVHNFAPTVLKHMEWLANHRGHSKSLLYANIVLNERNLDQVPELIRRANDSGWKTTIGVYHTLTATTRSDDALRLRPGDRLDALLAFLTDNPAILNLNPFVAGIADYVSGRPVDFCAFVDAPVLATRTTVMEDGAVHLCYDDPIGNMFQSTLDEIFEGRAYRDRINDYRSCRGCWTTCYTQRYLLVHPGSLKECVYNLKKVRALKK